MRFPWQRAPDAEAEAVINQHAIVCVSDVTVTSSPLVYQLPPDCLINRAASLRDSDLHRSSFQPSVE